MPASSSTAGLSSRAMLAFAKRERKIAVRMPDDRSGGDVEAADYHGEYPVHIASRFPGGSQQEVGQSDLRHGGNPVGKEEEADERHGQDGDRGSGGKEPPRHAFPEGLP